MSSHENTWERLINFFVSSRYCCLVNSHFIFQLPYAYSKTLSFSFTWNFSVVVKVLYCSKGTSFYKKQHKREENNKTFFFFHATSQKEESKIFWVLMSFLFSMIINVNSRYFLLIEWEKKMKSLSWELFSQSFLILSRSSKICIKMIYF